MAHETSAPQKFSIFDFRFFIALTFFLRGNDLFSEALGERIFAPARQALAEEALPQAVAACEILPAALGRNIGDVAALMAAF